MTEAGSPQLSSAHPNLIFSKKFEIAARKGCKFPLLVRYRSHSISHTGTQQQQGQQQQRSRAVERSWSSSAFLHPHHPQDSSQSPLRYFVKMVGIASDTHLQRIRRYRIDTCMHASPTQLPEDSTKRRHSSIATAPTYSIRQKTYTLQLE